MRVLLFFLFTLACTSNDSVILSNDAAPFISVWEIGDSRTLELVLPKKFTYDFTIDWGDGELSAIVAATDVATTHTYTQPGTYTLVVRGLLEALRSSATWGEAGHCGLVAVPQLGDVGWRDLNEAFAECHLLTLRRRRYYRRGYDDGGHVCLGSQRDT